VAVNQRGLVIHRKLRVWTFCHRAPILFSSRRNRQLRLTKPLVASVDVTMVEVRFQPMTWPRGLMTFAAG
jgi:hypothetical protein